MNPVLQPAPQLANTPHKCWEIPTARHSATRASRGSDGSKGWAFTLFPEVRGVQLLLLRAGPPLFILTVVFKTLLFPSCVSQGHCWGDPKAETSSYRAVLGAALGCLPTGAIGAFGGGGGDRRGSGWVPAGPGAGTAPALAQPGVEQQRTGSLAQHHLGRTRKGVFPREGLGGESHLLGGRTG